MNIDIRCEILLRGMEREFNVRLSAMDYRSCMHSIKHQLDNDVDEKLIYDIFEMMFTDLGLAYFQHGAASLLKP